MGIEAFLASFENLQDGNAGCGVGQWWFAVTNAFDEVSAFESKGFVSGEIDRLGVFFMENGETILKVHAIGIKDKFLFVRSDVVENGHLLVPDNNKALFFERMEPTDEDMRSPLIGKTECGNGDIGKVGCKIGPTTSRHPHGKVAEETQNNGDVMRRKAPESVFLGPHLAEIESVGVNVIDLAQFTRSYHFTKLHDARVIFQKVPDHQDSSTFLGNSLHTLSFGGGESHGFFDEDILARLQTKFDQFPMGLGGGGNGNSDDPFVTEDRFQFLDDLDLWS